MWMSFFAKNRQKMCSVTQHQCRRRQMWGISYSLFVCCKKMTWLNNLFMVRFQLIRMFSYANNKLQMCSVNQHQCRRRECFHKFTTLYLLQKMTCLDWTIYSWYGFNSWGCPLMLRTNYRCVQLPNISVDVAKYEENFQNSPSTLTLYLLQKKWLVLTEQSIHGRVSTH